jgi:hypothetical protein
MDIRPREKQEILEAIDPIARMHEVARLLSGRREGFASEADRLERLQAVDPDKVDPTKDANSPPRQHRWRPEPVRVEAEHESGESLQDPDSAEKLQVERELRRQEQGYQKRADFDGKRGHLGDLRLTGILLMHTPSTSFRDGPKEQTGISKFQVRCCASPRNDAARHFVSGQPLSLAVKNAQSPGTAASCL